ncbi:MAG: hypothetical protein UHM08_09300 [Bacteroidales bacterium]|nr:hypothetical protein [Bacteroidales bacterium]
MVIRVWALKDMDTGLFWNRIHKDFRPLSQNTLFCKSQRLAEESRDTCSDVRKKKQEGKDIQAVAMQIEELYSVDEVMQKYLNGGYDA